HMIDKIGVDIERNPLVGWIPYLSDVNASKRLLHPPTAHLTTTETQDGAALGCKSGRDQPVDINTKLVIRLAAQKHVTIIRQFRRIIEGTGTQQLRIFAVIMLFGDWVSQSA